MTEIQVRGRAWRDAGFEKQYPGSVCVHLVVASIAERPVQFTMKLEGLCGYAGSGGSGGAVAACAAQATHNATHLFNQFYNVDVVSTGNTVGDGSAPPPSAGSLLRHSHTMTDTIMPGYSSIYAIGCDTWQAQPSNLANDPGFEASELPLTPGFLTCSEEGEYPQGTYIYISTPSK